MIEQSSPDLVFSHVPPEYVDTVWHDLLPMIERALKQGQGDRTTAETMKSAVTHDFMTLWAIHTNSDIYGAVAFAINQYAKKRILFVSLLAGKDMRLWLDDLTSLLADYRDLQGADCIECSCRDGLVKELGKRGFKRKATIMELTA